MFTEMLTTDCPKCHARVLIPKMDDHTAWHWTVDGWIDARTEAEREAAERE